MDGVHIHNCRKASVYLNVTHSLWVDRYKYFTSFKIWHMTQFFNNLEFIVDTGHLRKIGGI